MPRNPGGSLGAIIVEVERLGIAIALIGGVGRKDS
jgi:hypothetical protein